MSLRVDDMDMAIITATQGGLPLAPRPFAEVARQVNLSEAEVIRRMRRMLDAGIIRRIGAVPNHYRLGWRANGMTVWDVDDAHVDALAKKVAALDFVTHCYLRPRHPPEWPYNLFAMVHGASREEVEEKRARIADILGRHLRASDILYSTKILKKTGIRLRPPAPAPTPEKEAAPCSG
jgi:DNA-binding Lrp family transcriptional regulator